MDERRYRDSIPYFLGSNHAISPRFEYENIRKLLKTQDTTLMEEYFYAFWIKTDPVNPGCMAYQIQKTRL